MRKRSAESNLPSKLDVTQVPSVNPEVTKNVNAFLENIRKVIGYPIELVGYDPLFGEADHPIFDVSLIDFEHLPYADHLSYIYNFYFQRGRLFEAQETLSEFQELLLGQFSYLFRVSTSPDMYIR